MKVDYSESGHMLPIIAEELGYRSIKDLFRAFNDWSGLCGTTRDKLYGGGDTSATVFYRWKGNRPREGQYIPPLEVINMFLSFLEKKTTETKLSETTFDQFCDALIQDLNPADSLIMSALNRCKQVAQNLVKFYEGKQASPKLIDLNDSINTALNLLGKESFSKIKISRKFGTLSKFLGDITKLNQVFIDILENAVEAIEDNGQIEIMTYQKRNMVYALVQDTGTGIREEDMTCLFTNPSFTTKNNGKGKGLGLGLCAALETVEEHDGMMSITSGGARKGTEVLVGFPVIRTAKPPPKCRGLKIVHERGRYTISADSMEVYA